MQYFCQWATIAYMSSLFMDYRSTFNLGYREMVKLMISLTAAYVFSALGLYIGEQTMRR